MTDVFLCDGEKVTLALEFQAQQRRFLPHFTVWIDGGHLYTREWLIGERRRMAWHTMLQLMTDTRVRIERAA